MKIHEYQAKAILKEYGVAVPRGETADRQAVYKTASSHGLSLQVKSIVLISR